MSDQDGRELDYQTVRQRVVRRFIKRLLFAINVFLWLCALLAGAFVHDLGGGFFWFLLLVIHFVYAFDIWSGIMDRMTQREIENLQRKGYRVTPPSYKPSNRLRINPDFMGGKQKREQVARLSDDGEIVYEDEPALKTARSGQDGVEGRA